MEKVDLSSILNDELSYNFETENLVLKVAHVQANPPPKSIFYNSKIKPIILHDQDQSFLSNEKINRKNSKKIQSVVKLFEQPKVCPIDTLELEALDDLTELKNMFCSDPESNTKVPIAPYENVDEEKLNIQPELNLEKIPKDLQEYGSQLVFMGFHPTLITYVLSLGLSDQDVILDKLVHFQEFLDEGISCDSIDYLVQTLGNDDTTIFSWAKNLIKLKELGFQEDQAREALVRANGKVNLVIDMLQ